MTPTECSYNEVVIEVDVADAETQNRHKNNTFQFCPPMRKKKNWQLQYVHEERDY